jgi:mevalonate kinase
MPEQQESIQPKILTVEEEGIIAAVHEILNSASIILSRFQFLEEENLSESAGESLRICREQVQRIVKISRELRLSSAKQSGMPVGGDFLRVIDLGLPMTEPWIKEDHLQAETLPPQEVIPVKMENGRLVKGMVHHPDSSRRGNDGKKV